jgi:hypothetical protein
LLNKFKNNNNKIEKNRQKNLLKKNVKIKEEFDDDYDVDFEQNLVVDEENQVYFLAQQSLEPEEKIDYKTVIRKTVDGNWQCLLCFKQTKKTNEIICHVNSHNNACKLCGKCFAGRNSHCYLKKHLQTCSKSKLKPPNFCDFCGKDFKFKCYMQRHMKSCLSRPEKKNYV